MLGLTPLGIIHTLISLVAVVYGVIALVQYKEISPQNRAGKIYLIATLLTAVTALGIFRHGGFGPPHALAILTLVALAIGTAAAYSTLFGRASRYVQTISYSITILFHLIPGVTETSTRLPPAAPLLANADAPVLKPIYLAMLVLVVIGIVLQIRRLRASTAS